MYIKLCMHPKIDALPERYQEMLSYFATGMTSREVSLTMGYASRSASTIRHSIFIRMGFKVFENGKTRPMRSEEVFTKIQNL